MTNNGNSQSLLTVDDLPNDFEYPASFRIIIEQGLTNLSPWEILTDNRLSSLHSRLQTRLGKQNFVPFAINKSNDDIACWSKMHNYQIVVLDENELFNGDPIKVHNDFWDWFRDAVEEMIDFNT